MINKDYVKEKIINDEKLAQWLTFERTLENLENKLICLKPWDNEYVKTAQEFIDVRKEYETWQNASTEEIIDVEAKIIPEVIDKQGPCEEAISNMDTVEQNTSKEQTEKVIPEITELQKEKLEKWMSKVKEKMESKLEN